MSALTRLTLAFRLCVGLLLLLGAAAAPLRAADVPLPGTPAPAAKPAEPAVPDPAHLDPEWWNYFASGKEPDLAQLGARYAAFTRHLATVIAPVEGEERSDLESLRGNIDRHWGRYLRMLQAPTPAPPTAPTLKDSYPLNEVLALGRDIDQQRRSAALEQQELDLLERSLARGQERFDAARVRYSELAADAPERLQAGVRLIRDRLRIETLNVELRWRHARQAALSRDIEQRASELAAARERIEAGEGAVAEWAATERDARKEAEGARADLLKLQLNDSIALAASDDERAQQRLHGAKTLRQTTAIAVAEATRASAVLAQHLLTRDVDGNAADPEQDRAAWRAQTTALEEQRAAANEGAGRLAQLRSAVALESAVAGDQSTLTAVYNKARAVLGAAENLLEDLKGELRAGQQIADMLDARLRQREGRVGQSVRLFKDALHGGWAEARSWLSKPMFDINETPVTMLGVLRVALILTVAWWLSVAVRGALARIGHQNTAVSPASLYAVGRVLHYLVLLFGFVIGLSSIGVDLTKFALFASALGVGVGFGLQTLISNFVSGLIILFEQSLNVGDLVELESGVTGVVKEINMRATRVTTGDGVDILVPNSEFMNGKVMNWTLQDTLRRVHVPFGVAYDSDKDLVRTAALAAAMQVEHTLRDNPDRPAQVWLTKFGENALEFELVVWLNLAAIKKPGSVVSDYLWALETQLREHGIEIPYPYREVHIRRSHEHKRPPHASDFSPL